MKHVELILLQSTVQENNYFILEMMDAQIGTRQSPYFRELFLVCMILEPDQHSSIYKTLVSGENALIPINN